MIGPRGRAAVTVCSTFPDAANNRVILQVTSLPCPFLTQLARAYDPSALPLVVAQATGPPSVTVISMGERQLGWSATKSAVPVHLHQSLKRHASASKLVFRPYLRREATRARLRTRPVE